VIGGRWWPMLEGLASSVTLQQIADSAGSTAAVVYMTWGQLGDHANQQRGYIGDIDPRVIAMRCGVSGWEIWRILAAFTCRGWIGRDEYEIRGEHGETLTIGMWMGRPPLARDGWPKSRNSSSQQRAVPVAEEDRDVQVEPVKPGTLRMRRKRERDRLLRAWNGEASQGVTCDASGVTTGVTCDASPTGASAGEVPGNPGVSGKTPGVTGDPPRTPLIDSELEEPPWIPHDVTQRARQPVTQASGRTNPRALGTNPRAIRTNPRSRSNGHAPSGW
jgi:hypothetical protein